SRWPKLLPERGRPRQEIHSLQRRQSAKVCPSVADGVAAEAGVRAGGRARWGGGPATDRWCAAGLLQQGQERAGLLVQVRTCLLSHRPWTVRVIQMTNEPLHRPPGR